jgi:hypothetical protein
MSGSRPPSVCQVRASATTKVKGIAMLLLCEPGRAQCLPVYDRSGARLPPKSKTLPCYCCVSHVGLKASQCMSGPGPTTTKIKGIAMLLLCEPGRAQGLPVYARSGARLPPKSKTLPCYYCVSHVGLKASQCMPGPGPTTTS